jgi:hypothetical protein
MEDMSRRRFLRGASIGAVAVGAAAAVGREGLAAAATKQAAAGTTMGTGAAFAAGAARKGANQAGAAKDEVMAHVVGGPSGTVEVYSGTNVVTLHDRGVANALLAALG